MAAEPLENQDETSKDPRAEGADSVMDEPGFDTTTLGGQDRISWDLVPAITRIKPSMCESLMHRGLIPIQEDGTVLKRHLEGLLVLRAVMQGRGVADEYLLMMLDAAAALAPMLELESLKLLYAEPSHLAWIRRNRYPEGHLLHGAAAKAIGVADMTLNRWVRAGKVKPTGLTQGGWRYYSEELVAGLQAAHAAAVRKREEKRKAKKA